ncbi:hypothetical protein [Spirillospora sp. CA-128828]|uniref:hypothetical protein n=1 Tax=Spirillospora sp. CA-128828 TaxID=3240033 RepID=UPI003D8E7E2E
MTPEQLAEIRQRVDGATAGPWKAEDLFVVAGEQHVADLEWLADTDEEWAEFGRNAVFVAAARQDVPALLDEVERLRAERDNAWNVVREGAANMRAQLATVRDERDEARTLAGVRGEAERDRLAEQAAGWEQKAAALTEQRDEATKARDAACAQAKRADELLVTAYNDLCEAVGKRRTTLRGAIKHAAAVRTERDRLVEQLTGIEARVFRAFVDSDIEGDDLNAMTVQELTAFVMTAIRNGQGPDPRTVALEQLADRYPTAFAYLLADAQARATRKEPTP